MRQPSTERTLSQDDIDNVFRNLTETVEEEGPPRKATPYDFRRPDRIAKDQLRAIHVLHENFARTLASSLSAYLRAYVVVNLVSVEQLSFLEFSQSLPSPTIIAPLAMRPLDGNAVIEINPSLAFPIIEILLGGSGVNTSHRIDREVTEIEQSILDAVYRIILHDMTLAWAVVTELEFEHGAVETEPQMMQIVAPNEAVVAISIEVKIGENSGMINIGIPSIIIKMLRQKFDQQWSMRKTESSVEERARMLRLIQMSEMHLDARLSSITISTQDLLALEEGSVLELDFAINRPLELQINGLVKFEGHVVDTGRKRGFVINRMIEASA
jgi:flagellar motor switch protein FliM